MAIITEQELQQYTQDFNAYPLNALIIGSAEEVVLSYLGYDPTPADIEEACSLEAVDTLAMQKPVITITTISLNAVDLVDGTDYRVVHNYLVFPTRRSGTLAVRYRGGLDPLPHLVKLACLQVATLKLMETGKKIGVTGTQLPDGMGHQFINYTNYEKYLKPLAGYRVL